MKVEIITKDIFEKEYHHKINNVYSICNDKREVFIKYMNGEFHDAYRFPKENVIGLEVTI